MEGPTLHCSVTYSLPFFENWELDLGNRDYVVSIETMKKEKSKEVTKNCQVIEKGGMASEQRGKQSRDAERNRATERETTWAP